MKKRWIIPAALGMLALLLASALWTLDRVGTDEEIYAQIEDAVGDYAYVGMSREDTLSSLADLAAYLRGELPELTRRAEVRGETQTVFNERERAHMVDVRALFELSRRVRRILFLAGACLLLAAALFPERRAWVPLSWGILLSWLAAALCLGVGMLVGFDELFLRFHHLFFTNDLWLLDPRTDAMIRMLPQGFFEQIVLRMARPLSWLGIQILALGLCLGVRAIRGKARKAKHAI